MGARLALLAAGLLLATSCGPREMRNLPPEAVPSASGATPSGRASPAVATARPDRMTTYPVPAGMRPHDVAPARDGGVWFTGQGSSELGWLDPSTGEVKRIALGMELGQRVFTCGYDEENATSANNQHDACFRPYYRSRSWARA